MRYALAGMAFAALLASGAAFAQSGEERAAKPNFVTEQPATDWSAYNMMGVAVTDTAGESIGQVNDLLIGSDGRVSTAVLGIGGLLGIGEKSVAVPFSSLAMTTGPNNERLVKVQLSKEALMQAPDFKASEKTAFTKTKERATEMGNKAIEKAGELKDQAADKIEEMTKDQPSSTGAGTGVEGGETSDRTPEKKTETPLPQQDSVDGKTSDRTPDK